jgi:hypothetical protein
MFGEDTSLSYERNQYATTSVNIVEVESHPKKSMPVFFNLIKKEATMALFNTTNHRVLLSHKLIRLSAGCLLKTNVDSHWTMNNPSIILDPWSMDYGKWADPPNYFLFRY